MSDPEPLIEPGHHPCAVHLWIEADSAQTIFRCVKCGARMLRDVPRDQSLPKTEKPRRRYRSRGKF